MHQAGKRGWRGRRLGAVALAVTASVVAAGCGGGDVDQSTASSGGSTDRLVINSFGGTWGEAIDIAFIKEFEQETGIDVELLSNADPAKSKLAIQQGNEPPEDILDYDYGTAASLEKEGLLAPIDYASFDQGVLEQVPENYRAPFALGWGSFPIAICYDTTKFEGDEPRTWADFWDVERFPGARGMIEWPVAPMPEFGRLADGVSVDEVYPIDVDAAYAKLDELKEHIPRFAKDPAALQQQLVDGTVAMEACYAHRVQKLIDAGAQNIGISYDQSRLITDYFMVWENAPNRENAMKFLDFILRKQPQATWARLGYTVPVNPEAMKELPDEVLAKLPPLDETFPTDDEWYVEGDPSNYERLVEEWGDRFGQ